MPAPSRAEVFGEVIELREQLDAIRRAYDDDDVEAIGDVLAGDGLDDDEEDAAEDEEIDDEDFDAELDD